MNAFRTAARGRVAGMWAFHAACAGRIWAGTLTTIGVTISLARDTLALALDRATATISLPRDTVEVDHP